jgi:hypothetical protein
MTFRNHQNDYFYRRNHGFPPQNGSGLLSNVVSARGILAGLDSAYTSDLGTKLRNLIPDSDSNARDGFPGERHALLKLSNGKMGVANYMGPGTEIVKRLRRGDPPRTLSDRVAMAHDIRYSLARNLGDIRHADQVMVRKLGEIDNQHADSRLNTTIGKKLIQAKMAAEDLGLLDKKRFVGNFGEIQGDEKSVLDRKLIEIEQEGFGYPGDDLKMSLLKKLGRKSSMRKKPKKKPKMTGKGKKSSMMKKPKLDLKKLIHFSTTKIIPLIISKLKGSGISIPLSGGSLIRDGAIRSKIAKLILMRAQKQKGLGLSGLSKIIGNTTGPILNFIPERRKAYVKEILAGLNVFHRKKMNGAGFWGDFAKGFVKGFTKTAEIAKPLLPLLPLLL